MKNNKNFEVIKIIFFLSVLGVIFGFFILYNLEYNAGLIILSINLALAIPILIVMAFLKFKDSFVNVVYFEKKENINGNFDTKLDNINGKKIKFNNTQIKFYRKGKNEELNLDDIKNGNITNITFNKDGNKIIDLDKNNIENIIIDDDNDIDKYFDNNDGPINYK